MDAACCSEFAAPDRRASVRRWGGWTTALAACVALGCGGGSSGPPTVHLQGNILINGQPVPGDAEGSISFKPTQAGMAKTTSVTIRQGRYDAPEVPQGPVKVFVNVQQPTGRMISEAGGTPYAEYRDLVPASFKGLELNATEDNENQDFDLK